ncbi:hypothetical protein [Xanthomonas campestris]|jgi:type II secretory pathway pseudopilin PulG|uniref:hypothetical protein n=1 Tax=Xanthomonas campestris TaxID=339 RepID=UPI0025A0DD2E|nr:hypothetical protein [Xanthomonas campestris]MDM7674533.1 hypothetical protein [Xanthomonas campestris pv. campestris]
MSSTVSNRDLFIIAVMAFAFGGLFAWALIDPPSAQRLATSSKQPSEWPAWVQAIGSVLAIAVAIAVPYWQKSKEKAQRIADDSARARVVAGAIQPYVSSYRRRAKYFQHQIERSDLDAMKKMPPDCFEGAETLRTFQPDFHLLGHAGAIANSFVASLYWLDQGLKVVQLEQLRPESREQITTDCTNTVELAVALETALIPICGRLLRNPASQT